MARKRRKQRWRINPIPLMALALAVNIIFGLSYSPILALNRVRVEGSMPSEKDQINSWLQDWANRPLANVNARKIEGQVLSFPEVSEAHFEHNAFGRGRLVIKQRDPVGKMEGTDLILASDGGLFRCPDASINSNLPRVSAPPSVFRIGLAMQGGTELGGLVLAAKQVASDWPDFSGVIELNQVGVLCLNRLEHGRVVLGGFDQLPEKLKQLRALLAKYPELSTAPYDINVVAPDRPAFRLLAVSHEPNRQSLQPQRKLDNSGQHSVLRAGLHADPGVGNGSKSSGSPGADESQPAGAGRVGTD